MAQPGATITKWYHCSILLPLILTLQIFYSFFKTLVGQRVTIELKNDMEMEGRLESVDQFLNIKLADINVVDEEKYPHLVRNRLVSKFN